MKTTEREAEEKRLRKNANQRRKYALLSHVKKEALLQKNRERYVENKKKEAKGRKIDCTRNANLQQTRIQEDDIIISGAANITNSDKRSQGTPSDIMSARGKAQISLHSSCELDERNQGIPSDTMSARGKAQISLDNSCEIGSCSLTATEADHSRTPTFPLQQDFPISRTSWVKHITTVTNCECNDVQGKPHALHTHENNHHTTTSRKRARTKVNKVGDDNPNIIDEIQSFQSARWISAAEAMWRIYSFDMNEMRPAVQSLHLHLPDSMSVMYPTNCEGANSGRLYSND